MSFVELDSITGPLSQAGKATMTLAKKIKYGVNYNVESEIKTDGWVGQGYRKGALFSNNATMLGYVRFEETPDMPVYDGVNHVMIGENGDLEGNLVCASLENLYDVTRDGARNLATEIMSVANDNTVLLMYNMLRIFYIKQLQEREPDMVIRPGETIYDDGHVRINAAQAFGINEDMAIRDFHLDVTSSDIGPGTPRADNLHREFGTDDNGCYLVTNGLTKKELVALSVACGTWDTEEWPVRVMHPCSTRTILYHTSGNRMPQYEAEFEWSNFTSNDMAKAIKKIVKLNRNYVHFDMAYAMLSQVLVSHIPRSAEAFIWYRQKHTFTACRSVTARGVHELITNGTPTCTDSSRWSTITNWSRDPSRIILHSIALNEAIVCAEFEYINRKDEMIDPMAGLVGSDYIIDCGLARDLAFLGMRFGRQFSLPYTTHAGLKRPEWNAEDAVARFVYTDIIDVAAVETYGLISTATSDTLYRLPLQKMVPLCYPILSMGINSSHYFMNEHEVESELKMFSHGTLATDDISKAHRMMMMLRIMGWDIKMTRHSDNQVFSNWAPNSNGHYVPLFGETDSEFELFKFDLDHLTRRNHCWIEEPPYYSKKLAMTMKLSFANFRIICDNKAVRMVGNRVSLTTDVDPNTQATTVLETQCAYAPVLMQRVNLVSRYSDFREAWTSTSGLTVTDAAIGGHGQTLMTPAASPETIAAVAGDQE